jgi:hypothetical protein
MSSMINLTPTRGKTGRNPYRPEQLAQFSQWHTHRVALERAPDKLDRSHVLWKPRMRLNDELSNCTCAGLANNLEAAAMIEGWDIDIPDPKTKTLYGLSCGYDGTPATDNGGIEADVLLWAMQHGFDTGGQVAFVPDTLVIDPQDLNGIRMATLRGGTAYLGVDLAPADLQPGVWDTVGRTGDSTPSSDLGHCLLSWDWTGVEDTDIVRLPTWNGHQPATWRWFKNRIREAHAVLWRQVGNVAAGIDYDDVRDRMARLLSASYPVAL